MKDHPKIDVLLYPPTTTPTPSEQKKEGIADEDKGDVEKKEEFKRPTDWKHTKAMEARSKVKA